MANNKLYLARDTGLRVDTLKCAEVITLAAYNPSSGWVAMPDLTDTLQIFLDRAPNPKTYAGNVDLHIEYAVDDPDFGEDI